MRRYGYGPNQTKCRKSLSFLELLWLITKLIKCIFISKPLFFTKNVNNYFCFATLKVDAVSEKSYTYSELSKMIRNTAGGLVKIGIKPGDIITIHSPNCVEYPVIYLAIQEVGAVSSPVNPLYTAGTIIGQDTYSD